MPKHSASLGLLWGLTHLKAESAFTMQYPGKLCTNLSILIAGGRVGERWPEEVPHARTSGVTVLLSCSCDCPSFSLCIGARILLLILGDEGTYYVAAVALGRSEELRLSHD